MTQTVDIEKTAPVIIEVQVDYVKCEECGEELPFTLYSDNYGDLQITVSKCDCE